MPAHQRVLAGLGASSAGDPLIGPIWVKFMGGEKLGPDRARVTICTDIGWWHETNDSKPQVRRDRANLDPALDSVTQPVVNGIEGRSDSAKQ